MALPSAFINHLSAEGYHPRSNRHSNALGEALATDLFAHCPLIRDRSLAGDIVYDLNFNIQAFVSWNVDLVIGTPPPGRDREVTGEIDRGKPSTIQIAVELKSVMTEHRKAVRNRVRDLDAHHQHVHHYNPRTVAGGILVINSAERFRSPLRESDTIHTNPEDLVRHCVQQLRGVTIRNDERTGGLDAASALVVSYSNLEDTAEFVIKPPAPAIGDPLHYDAFVQRICSAYERLWA